jgi:septum formation protein
MKAIVLASSSPRRKELLEKAGLKFTVDPVEVDERLCTGNDPFEQARSISLAKARAAAPRHPGSIIIAADTLGWLDGQPLGKPLDAADARRMLGFMSAKWHRVITGYTIMDSDIGTSTTGAEETMVRFKKLSPGDIDDYVKTGEPLDKAGAYAIQGLGARLVEKIQGDYFNVIGLPIHALARDLAKFGVSLPLLSQFDNAADSPAK